VNGSKYYNLYIKKSCKAIKIRFGRTLFIKYGDLYFICLFNDKPIVISSCGKQGKIDWVKFTFTGTFILLPLILYWP
jgi:hypothetical protein